MSHDAIIKFAPIFEADRFDDPAWNRPGRTLYQRGAFRFLPGRSTVPLLVDHDEAREVGIVHELFELDWIDGPWIAARATVTDPPGWLRRGETKASFGSKTFDRREYDIRGTRAEVIAGAFVEEVSVLSPSVKPVEPRAEVWSFRPAEPPSSPAAGHSSDRALSPARVPAVVVRSDTEIDELHRRIEWLESRGVRADLEQIVETMNAELRTAIRHIRTVR